MARSSSTFGGEDEGLGDEVLWVCLAEGGGECGADVRVDGVLKETAVGYVGYACVYRG